MDLNLERPMNSKFQCHNCDREFLNEDDLTNGWCWDCADELNDDLLDEPEPIRRMSKFDQYD
jgi:predicted amidophosphoribosyltransferase